MAETTSQVESKDNQGRSDHFNGSISATGFFAIPSAPSGIISEFCVENMQSNPVGATLQVSLDGGIQSKTLQRGDVWLWDPKGQVTQIYLKGAVGINYETVLNRENF